MLLVVFAKSWYVGCGVSTLEASKSRLHQFPWDENLSARVIDGRVLVVGSLLSLNVVSVGLDLIEILDVIGLQS